MNNIIKLFLIFNIGIFTGCRDTMVAKNKLFLDDISVNVALNKVRSAKQDGFAKSLVYGTLTISGRGNDIKSVNLDCISLDINGRKSNKIYIDSVADFLSSEYLVKNNRISIDVYWRFNHIIQYEDLKNFDFSFDKPDLADCIILE